MTVDNVAPLLTADNASVSVSEGAAAANTGTFSDPGDDIVTLAASVGTITDNNNGTWSWAFDSTDGPDNSQTVTITATDSDNATTSIAFDLTVDNVAPILAADNASVTVSEGATAANTGTFSDPGDDIVTLAASVGTIIDNNNGTWSWSLSTAGSFGGSQSVTIMATDSDDATTSLTFSLTVDNVAPILAVDNDVVNVSEGTTASNTGTFSNSGDDTVTLSASVGTITDNNNGTWSWTFDTSDSDQTQSVIVTAIDSDGEGISTTFSLTVTNEDPVITSVTSSATLANRSASGMVSLAGEFSDTGNTDTHNAVVDWGDGTDAETVTLTDLPGGSGTFAGSHTYNNGGMFTITVTITDDDGGLDEATTLAVVLGVAINNGVLEIVGSDAADILILNSVGGDQLRVLHRIDQEVASDHFDLSLVDRIFVDAGSGSDFVSVARGLDVPTIIWGRGGNDFLRGGGGSNLILGGDGGDTLMGQRGRDILIGGRGRDLLLGGSGDDILVGDDTTNTLAELQQIQDVWNGSGTFDTRSNDVRPRFVLLDDASRDFTVGGAGDDLLLAPSAAEGESHSSAIIIHETLPTVAEISEFGLGVLNSNPVDANDVNGDGTTSPLDALQIINDLNRRGPRTLDSDLSQPGCELDETTAAWDEDHPCIDVGMMYFPDTNTDGSISPVDALRVVNQLNTIANTEGEPTSLENVEANPGGFTSLADWERLNVVVILANAAPAHESVGSAHRRALPMAEHSAGLRASVTPGINKSRRDAVARRELRNRAFEEIVAEGAPLLLDELVDELVALLHSK